MWICSSGPLKGNGSTAQINLYRRHHRQYPCGLSPSQKADSGRGREGEFGVVVPLVLCEKFLREAWAAPATALLCCQHLEACTSVRQGPQSSRPDILCLKSGVSRVTSPFTQFLPPLPQHSNKRHSLAVSSNTNQSILWELLFMPDYTVIMAYHQTHQNNVVINCIWLHYEIQVIFSQSPSIIWHKIRYKL